MHGEHANAVAYRRTADAFRSADYDTLASLIAVDAVWHVPGAHRVADEIRGRDQIILWLTQMRSRGFWFTEHDVFANDDHVCALSMMSAQRGGAEVRTRVVSIFHYRGGQQLERWFYPDDLATWDQIIAE